LIEVLLPCTNSHSAEKVFGFRDPNIVGDECLFCSVDPDDVAKKGFMEEFINAIVDTLIAKIAKK